MATKRVSKKTATKSNGRLKKGFKWLRGGGVAKVTPKKKTSRKKSTRRRKK